MQLLLQTIIYSFLGVFYAVLVGFEYFFGLLPVYVTLPLTVLWLGIAFFSYSEMGRQNFAFPIRFRSYLALILVSLYSVAFLGIAFSGLETTLNSFVSYIIFFLILFNISVCIFALIKEKEWRVTILAAGILIILWTLSVALTASMSATGAWL